MPYTINEATFNLPDSEMIDSSINIVRFPKLGTSLIIARSLMNEGETLETNFDNQIDKLKGQLSELRYQPKQATKLGGGKGIDAFQISNQFKREKDHFYQFQLAFVVPDTLEVVSLTYVKNIPLAEAELKHWEQIKASFVCPLPAFKSN
jgi:hypothetical protein